MKFPNQSEWHCSNASVFLLADQIWQTVIRASLSLSPIPWLIKRLCKSKIMQAAFLTKKFKLIQNIQK